MATATLDERELEKTELPASPAAEPAEHYEVVDGQVVEEPPLGARETWITAQILRAFILFDPKGARGTEVDEMLFVLKDGPRLRRRPDLAFVSVERWPVDEPAPQSAVWDVIPDLAVEVVSPTDLTGDLMSKIAEYFRAGVRFVWMIYPNVAKLYAYESPKAVRILDAGDVLTGGAILPGFKLPLSRIFVADRPEPTPIAS